MRICSPPSLISSAQPLLAATLLEIVHERALHAPTQLLSQDDISGNAAGDSEKHQLSRPVPSLSEQSILILTVVDALPNLSLELLEEWLPISADLINKVHSEPMREHCRLHLWETMVGGDMDPDRSQLCVAWWTTQGGREALLFGAVDGRGVDEPVMSGALTAETSKL